MKKLVYDFNKLENLLDKKRERHKVKVNTAYSNQPTLLPQDEHNQLLQDKSYKQNVPNEKVANKTERKDRKSVV